MRITVELLEELGACKDGIEEFKEFLGKRKYVLDTARNLQLAADAGLDVLWLIEEAGLTVGPLVYSDGAEFWYKDGLRHRDDGPAITWTTGSQFWYQNDWLHRTDGPAAIYASGTRRWFRRGLLHRIGGPAVVYADGEKQWFVDGQYIRSESP